VASVFAVSVVDGRFKDMLGQTKDHNIGICCFSVKHAAPRGKTKDWLSQQTIYKTLDINSRSSNTNFTKGQTTIYKTLHIKSRSSKTNLQNLYDCLHHCSIALIMLVFCMTVYTIVIFC
jgi:hypothetical protein